MSKECFVCSGMKWLGWFGEWFERTYKECCIQHDAECEANTAQRVKGLPHLIPTMVVHWRFYEAMRRKGIPIIPEIAFIAVTLLYWPGRVIAWASGRAEVI